MNDPLRLIRRCTPLLGALLLGAQVSYANASSPTAPTHVVAERTSDSTVRITWSASSDDVGVAGYNVYRDNRYISTVSNPRLGDIQLAPAVVYTYYVVAFDAQGNFSPRSSTASTGTTSEQPTDGISVDGNRISWPDDGWYQVQDVPNYTEQCAGTRFCDVQPGQYQVVNHTTGERFPVVTVGQSNDDQSTNNDDNANAGINVNGSRISWPDDGWYQVQDANTFTEQCNGTRFCDVSPGNYIVINHSTGTRTVVTVDDSNTQPSGGSYINAGNALDRWASVVSVINEEPLAPFFDNLAAELNFRIVNNGGILAANGIDFSENRTIDPPYQFVAGGETFDVFDEAVYTCASGGTMLRYNGNATNVSSRFNGYDSVFENCAISTNQFNGTIGGRGLLRAIESRFPFVNFQRLSSNGDTQSIDGIFYTGNLSRAIIDRRSGWRNLTFSDSANNVTLTSYNIDRVEFNNRLFMGETAIINGAVVNTVSYEVRSTINGQFNVTAPFTEGLTVDVAVDLTYQDNVREAFLDSSVDFPGRDTQLPFSWQSGSVTIFASDGSSMTVLPAADNAFQLELSTGESLGPFAWTGRFELSRD